MIKQPSIKRETRYGMPAADQVLYNRYYVLGYSYYFRQAKWALEIVDPDRTHVERLDNFRSDFRIPQMFRTDLTDYRGSGYDRGHLVCSANQLEVEIQNSETFLLSNMTPQRPRFNRGIWRELEEAIRTLDRRDDIYETYVICGPVFYFDKPVESIGNEDDNEVTIPIPNAYFKSVLTENKNGRLYMWSFMMDNEDLDGELEDYQVTTKRVEQFTGIKLWENLMGDEIEEEKNRVRGIWHY